MRNDQQDTPLAERILDALGWRFTSVLLTFILQFTVAVILARLLPPEAFGLVGQALIVIGFAGVVSEAGMASALVQRRDLTEIHIRVGFTLSILWGSVLTLLMWISASLVAEVFRTPQLTPILRLLSLTFLFANLGTTSGALLQRRLDFRRSFWVELLSYACGYAVVGISLTLLHYGVWALAWASLVQVILKAGLLFVTSPHAVRPCFAIVEVRQLLSFGVGMSLARLVNYTAQNGDYFVIGRWLGPLALGLYTRAYHLMVLPLSQFSSVIGSVLFPVYAEIQNEPTRLRRAYLGAISLSALVVFPTLTGIAIAAPEIMRGIFGPQWTGATAALQILCIGGPFRAMYNVGDSLARAKGAVYAQFIRHSVYAACIIVAALVGVRWQIEGVAAGVVSALAIMYFMMANLSLKLIDDSWKAFLEAQMPGLILALNVAALAFPTALILRTAQLPDLIVLAGTLITCAITATMVTFLLRKRWLNRVPVSVLHQFRRIWSERGSLFRHA